MVAGRRSNWPYMFGLFSLAKLSMALTKVEMDMTDLHLLLAANPRWRLDRSAGERHPAALAPRPLVNAPPSMMLDEMCYDSKVSADKTTSGKC